MLLPESTSSALDPPPAVGLDGTRPPELRLVRPLLKPRLIGKVTWLSGRRKTGVLASIGGDSLSFALDSSCAPWTPREGDLVSYEERADAGAEPSAQHVLPARPA